MKSVSPFEASLLRILRFFLEQASAEQVTGLIASKSARPACLSRNSVELIQDSLAKGCMLLLVRTGGWKRGRFLRAGHIADGSLWERTRPNELGLSFSLNTVAFLLWITAEDPRKQRRGFESVGPVTVGDRFLFYLAYKGLREAALCEDVRSGWSIFRDHSLCRLMFPDDFPKPAGGKLDLDPWVNDPVGSCILEVLQERLTARWLAVEESKRNPDDGQRFQRLGRVQEQVLTAFLDAVEACNRRDLARFLLPLLAKLLEQTEHPYEGIRHMATSGQRLAARQESRRLATVVLHQVERLQRWDLEARAVGYFDEGYAGSQLWKADWERWHGKILLERVRSILAELKPL